MIAVALAVRIELRGHDPFAHKPATCHRLYLDHRVAPCALLEQRRHMSTARHQLLERLMTQPRALNNALSTHGSATRLATDQRTLAEIITGAIGCDIHTVLLNHRRPFADHKQRIPLITLLNNILVLILLLSHRVSNLIQFIWRHGFEERHPGEERMAQLNLQGIGCTWRRCRHVHLIFVVIVG